MKKRSLAVILALVLMLSAVLTSCSNSLSGSVGTDPTTNVTVSSKEFNMSLTTSFQNSFGEYISDNFDFTAEDENLKKFAFISLLDAHDEGLAVTEGSENTDETDNKAFLESIGFTGVTEYTVGEGATVDVNDTVGMVVSYMPIKASLFSKIAVINVSLLGTGGANEWSSNFDIGADTEDYQGDHPDWTDKDNHKGFDVAANRVINILKEYISTNCKNLKPVIVISGYSRGAAVANLVAQKIVDDRNILGYKNTGLAAYTFATPRSTTAADAHDAKYDCIKNYINTDDTITHLPTENMKFVRYGVDVEFSIQNDETLKKQFDELSNQTYDASCAETIQSTLEEMFSCREDAYRVIEDDAHMLYSIGSTDYDEYTDKEYVQELGNKFLKEMADKGLGQFFKDAGITEEKQTFIESGENDEDVEKEVTYYIWHCYSSDGLILRIVNTMVSNYMGGNTDHVLDDAYLLSYTTLSTQVYKIVFQLLYYPDYFMQAHSPAGYYFGSFRPAE